MQIEANGIAMNYEVKGTGENLVLIHGLGDNLNMWYHQVTVFSKSYRVITYDVRGSGKTESPEGDYSISILAKDTYELMRGIKVEGAYFLGYSMGGRVALELALSHPEMVKALILANSSVGLTTPTPEALERRRVMMDLIDKGDVKKFTEMMTTNAFSPGFESKNPAEFKKYMEVKSQNKLDGVGRLLGMLATPASPPDLSKVKCPVLLIVGEKDQYMGVAQAKQASEMIAGSKVVVLPTGHAAAIEMPDKFNSAVLEFLSEVSRG
ncbi:MAG: alpha/beta hydrolase [Chloroflexota bacterium]|nr:MAG: alpha/beta hydrolase [Chloroflexota bacterium]